MHQVKLLLVALGGLMVVLSASAQLFAQDDVIGKRKGIMRGNNAAVKAIAKAAKGNDYATIQMKAKEIVNGLDAVASLFPKGSTAGKTRARPEIWEKPDEFKNKLANARKAADALSNAADAKNEAEVNAKVKELGTSSKGACGDCHKMFRAASRK